MTVLHDLRINGKRVVYGDSSDRTGGSYDEVGCEFYEVDNNGNVYKYDGDSWVQTASGGATHVHLSSSDLYTVIQPFNAQVYSGTLATGDTAIQITDNLQDYTDWEFHVVGVDADDDITIGISLDGVNFVLPAVVNILTGTAVAQDASTLFIEVPGVYKIAMGGGAVPMQNISFRALQIYRRTATGSNTVTVQAIGTWGAT